MLAYQRRIIARELIFGTGDIWLCFSAVIMIHYSLRVRSPASQRLAASDVKFAFATSPVDMSLIIAVSEFRDSSRIDAAGEKQLDKRAATDRPRGETFCNSPQLRKYF